MLSVCQACSMDSQLRSKRLRWYGHVCRMLDPRSCCLVKSKIQTPQVGLERSGMILSCLTFNIWTSNDPTVTLRTSQPGETGLGPHTPSTCAECVTNYCYYYCCPRSSCVSKDFDQNQSPRLQLQRLKNCLDQKVTMVRHQSTGTSVLLSTQLWDCEVQTQYLTLAIASLISQELSWELIVSAVKYRCQTLNWFRVRTRVWAHAASERVA